MIKNTLQLIQNMGPRYTVYRARHEVEKKLGLLKKKHPTSPLKKYFISLENWRNQKETFFIIPERELFQAPKFKSLELLEQSDKLLNGNVLFFSHEWKALGLDYDWITNPDSDYQYNIDKHWSEISDLNPANGDIKYVWEKSRFTYLLTIIRRDHSYEEDHSEFVFSEIESWIRANPINQGPNWRCSQEISLRLMNWCYALAFYKNSKSLSEDRWNTIQNAIYWSLHHVYNHIDFSRIAVRNNHAITETLMLSISHMLFPFIPETKKWAKKGRKWFEQEVAYQIYEDGTFLQFSMNYHRVMIQLLTLGISLTEKHQKPFSKIVYDRAYKILNFLYQCLQEENGYLPNYGANDGAIFFPLNTAEYRDYRPQLNALHKLLTGELLFSDEELTENSYWIGEKVNISLEKTTKHFPPIQKQYGAVSFPVGGYYLIREQDSFTFVRCGSYKDRPSQSDNLHVDIWHKGENILRDSGSFKYNTTEELAVAFRGCQAHNTLSIDGEDQMLKGDRFIWYYWVKKASARLTEGKDYYKFDGKINAFRQIHSDIWHHRTVVKVKNKLVWKITDVVENAEGKQIEIFWHINPSSEDKINITCKDSEGHNLIEHIDDGWYSALYGYKERVKVHSFKSYRDRLETTIKME